jgi:carboxylesterase type B
MSKSANQIASAQGKYFQQALFSDSYLRKFLPWTPHIDGTIIKQGVMEAFISGAYAPKPAILGSTSEEGQMYIYLGFGKPMSALEYRLLLFGVRPKQSTEVYKMYKPELKSDARSILTELTTDFVFYCPARTVARSISQFAPVYTYVFNNNISIPSVWNHLHHCIGKVCHGVELPFVFQSARKEPWVFSQNEFLLSDSMIYYWTNFAKTGNPNNFQIYRTLGPSATPQIWLPYKERGYYSELSMVLNENGNYLTQGHKFDKCRMWDQGEYKAKK